jgi:hypothetical protein
MGEVRDERCPFRLYSARKLETCASLDVGKRIEEGRQKERKDLATYFSTVWGAESLKSSKMILIGIKLQIKRKEKKGGELN